MAPVECKEMGQRLEIAFVSELRYACEALQTALAFGRQFGVHPHRLSIVLREMLKNAVIHGNHEDGQKRVACVLDGGDESCLRITVRDNGTGFNYRALDMGLPENGAHIECRGYKLINAYADDILFNNSGNEVTVQLNTNGVAASSAHCC